MRFIYFHGKGEVKECAVLVFTKNAYFKKYDITISGHLTALRQLEQRYYRVHVYDKLIYAIAIFNSVNLKRDKTLNRNDVFYILEPDAFCHIHVFQKS